MDLLLFELIFITSHKYQYRYGVGSVAVRTLELSQKNGTGPEMAFL